MPLEMERRLSVSNDPTYSMTEYRGRFLSPRREDYIPHASLPKIGSARPKPNLSILNPDCDLNGPSTSSEYRLCYPNHHPRRPHVFHEQPSHVFDYVPMPLNSKSMPQFSTNKSPLKNTEYQERFPNYSSFIPARVLIPPHLSGSTEVQPETAQKRDRMARSQFFHQLVVDSEQFTGGQRIFGTSEQRNAFRWPYNLSHSQRRINRSESSAALYSPYNVPKSIYEPLPTIQRTIVNDTH